MKGSLNSLILSSPQWPLNQSASWLVLDTASESTQGSDFQELPGSTDSTPRVCLAVLMGRRPQGTSPKLTMETQCATVLRYQELIPPLCSPSPTTATNVVLLPWVS